MRIVSPNRTPLCVAATYLKRLFHLHNHATLTSASDLLLDLSELMVAAKTPWKPSWRVVRTLSGPGCGHGYDHPRFIELRPTTSGLTALPSSPVQRPPSLGRSQWPHALWNATWPANQSISLEALKNLRIENKVDRKVLYMIHCAVLVLFALL